MRQRNRYHTKQRDSVLKYLSDNAEKHLTAGMVAAALSGQVGQTTVYRNLDLLVKEKAVVKYEMPDGKSAYYQYREQKSDGCHLLCTECGRMVALNCRLVDTLGKHIQSEHSFHFDPAKTVLYGRCRQCASY